MHKIGRITLSDHVYDRLVRTYMIAVVENDYGYFHLQNPDTNSLAFQAVMDEIHQEEQNHLYLWDYIVAQIRVQTHNDHQSNEDIICGNDFQFILSTAKAEANECFCDIVHDMLPPDHALWKAAGIDSARTTSLSNYKT